MLLPHPTGLQVSAEEAGAKRQTVEDFDSRFRHRRLFHAHNHPVEEIRAPQTEEGGEQNAQRVHRAAEETEG